MLTCTAALSWMVHDDGGRILNLGRRRRRPDKALRKAARERDRGRCRFPGVNPAKPTCTTSSTGATGAAPAWRTSSACAGATTRPSTTAATSSPQGPDGSFAFFQPGGTPLPLSPPLPAPGGTIAGVHDAEITPETIIPPWFGERLDLDYAIYTCLANERVYQDRAAGCAPRGGIPPCDCRPGEPADAIAYFREYYAEHPEERRPAGAPGRRRGPVSVKVVSTG